MEEGKGKLDPTLPPNYVSLAQLQDRWIRKQEELKLKRKEEEQEERDSRTGNWSDENQNQRGSENELHEKMAGLSVRDVLRGKGEKDDRMRGVIEDKGKRKEKVIGAFQDGEAKKKKKNKKKSDSRNKEKARLRSEIKDYDSGDGIEGVEIVPGNEVKVGIKGVLNGESSGRDGGLKETEEIGGVHTVEVLPGNVKRVDYRSGFKSKKEYSKKTEDERGYGKWRRERRNGEYRERYKLKENGVDVLKGNKAEPKGEDRAEDRVLEVCNETGGVNGKNKNDYRVELEKKGDDEVLMVQSAKSNENGRFGNGYRRYGDNVRYIMGVKDGADKRYTRFGSSGDRRKTKPRESGMIWVKKEEKKGADAAEVGSSGIPKDQA